MSPLKDNEVLSLTVDEAEALRQRAYAYAAVVTFRGLPRQYEVSIVCKFCDDARESYPSHVVAFVVDHHDCDLSIEVRRDDNQDPPASLILAALQDRHDATLVNLATVTGLKVEQVRRFIEEPKNGLIAQGSVRITHEGGQGRGNARRYALVRVEDDAGA